MVRDGDAVKKYVTYIISTQQVDGVEKQMVMRNTLYFDQNKLIKAEDFATGEGKEMKYAWYFDNGKCIYPEVLSESDGKRVGTLIAIGDALSKQISK